MKKTVLILSVEDDYHAHAVQALLRKRGHDAHIVDTGLFPTELQLSQGGPGAAEVRLNGRPLHDYHSIWWRRVRFPVPSDELEGEERRFAFSECRDALWGGLRSAGIPIYNDPEAEQRADRKPYQLKLAHECGLRIPDTLITTSPAEVREFRSRHEQIIYKTFNSTDIAVTDTRPLLDEDLSDLWRLKYAPAIFQEFVPLGLDYRVTIVEDDVFAAEIEITRDDARFDWRNDLAYQSRPAELPGPVAEGLRELRRRLGLSSGSADFRVGPDGEFYFFELNPSGQFLFLDIRAGLDIAPRFCEMLTQ